MEFISVEFWDADPSKIIIKDNVNSHYSIVDTKNVGTLVDFLSNRSRVKEYLRSIGRDNESTIYMGRTLGDTLGIGLDGNYVCINRLPLVVEKINMFMGNEMKDGIKNMNLCNLLFFLSTRKNKNRKGDSYDLERIPF